MAIEKLSIIDQIELTSTGNVQVRMKLMVVENGTKVLAERYHRTLVADGADPLAQMAAVNEHLAAMGEALIEPADLERLAIIVAEDRKLAGRKLQAKSMTRAK